ncbi:MAG TPA: hypothetical protein GXX49_04565 [Clostridiaceae bacterium]|nr:hypothetical protein [Clostridiaceae bacterium]
MRGLIKFSVLAVTVIVLFAIAVSILQFAFRVLLPIAILVLAAYAVYIIVTGRRAK